MKNSTKRFVYYVCILVSLTSCKKYLNIVPDNIATIDYSFRNRMEAEKYLFTCYHSLPQLATLGGNPALLGSDELVTNFPGYASYGDISGAYAGIFLGQQSKVNPIADYWDGRGGGLSYFQALRECNIFLENIHLVPDLQSFEKARWIAEVKFLKAYYHYWLFRMYGPIPLIRTNLPIAASVEEVRVFRAPVDTVVNYIVSLLDEAAPDLPGLLMNETEELGRVTKAIALSVKAELLVTAASPFFNGNTDYANFKNKNGTALFNNTVVQDKWKRAAIACKEAIEVCHSAGVKLYKYVPRVVTVGLSDSTYTQMNIRGAITEKWNSETIWGASNSMSETGDRGLQANAQAYLSPIGSNSSARQNLAVPLNMTELFYTSNGVPINEDPSYDYANRFSKLRTVTADYRYYMKEKYVTAQINFDREPRYYADLAFDGSLWYAAERADDNSFWVEAKLKQTAGSGVGTNYGVSGYWPKKLVNFNNAYTAKTYTIETYPWPVMRLAELYLLYAEALNESNGPSAEAYQYIDLVRARAGLKGVVASWQGHSRKPGKPTDKDGLRQIIQQERLIEVAFEGKRFWDIRRWKTAPVYLNQPVTGWNITASNTTDYYRVKVLYTPSFSLKDYLWPITEKSVVANPNLVQNPGW
jgi:hypothetical protein